VHRHSGASAGSGRRGSAAPFVVWALFGVVAVAIFVTYSRLPARELWHVSGSGPAAGAGRAFVFTNYSLALAAVTILVLLLDRVRDRPRRLLVLVAIAMCAVGPVFVDSSDLDARLVNAVAAVGVGIAFLLSITARTPARAAAAGWDRGDWARLAFGLALLVIALPAMAADLGFYLDRTPVLGSIFQTGALRHEPGVRGLHAAVHRGHHEGLDGALLAWSALVLWRCLPTVVGRRLRGLFGACLAGALCYGAAVAAGDFWLEQIVKRGWTVWNPDLLYPGFTTVWAVVFGIAAAIWMLTVRPGLAGSGERRPRNRGLPRLGNLIVLALAAAVAWPATSAASGRPNIEKVVVSRDRTGILTFAVRFASAATLDADTKLQVMLDTDRDSSTGSEGAEYALDYSSPTGVLDPTSSLLASGEGDFSARPQFTETPRSATFRISVDSIGDPGVFDFWVFVEVNGDLVETAPTHVVVSTYAQPWTYPKDGAPGSGQPYPTATYEDFNDTSLETSDIPWLLIVFGIIGIGGLLGLGGWAYDRRRGNRDAPPPGATGANGPAGAAAEPLVVEGPPAPDLVDQLREARELIGRDKPKRALDVADRVRMRALATEDLPGVVEAWRVAADVYHHSRGKPQQRAGRIAFACQQNVRFLTRGRALAR